MVIIQCLSHQKHSVDGNSRSSCFVVVIVVIKDAVEATGKTVSSSFERPGFRSSFCSLPAA